MAVRDEVRVERQHWRLVVERDVTREYLAPDFDGVLVPTVDGPWLAARIDRVASGEPPSGFVRAWFEPIDDDGQPTGRRLFTLADTPLDLAKAGSVSGVLARIVFNPPIPQDEQNDPRLILHWQEWPARTDADIRAGRSQLIPAPPATRAADRRAWERSAKRQRS